MKQGLFWKETGVGSDNTEATESALVIAARPKSPAKIAELVSSNCVLTQNDQAVVAMTTAYCSVLSMLVPGDPLDTEISGKLIAMMSTGELPFNAMPGKGGAPISSKTSGALWIRTNSARSPEESRNGLGESVNSEPRKVSKSSHTTTETT